VAALDTFRRQGAEGGHVLGEPHSHNDACQLRGALHTHERQGALSARVNLGGTAHNPNGHGHLELTDQITTIILAPGRKRCVSAAARRVGVCTGLNGAPIITGDDSIHAFMMPFCVAAR
jgi:hypothetical protein